MDAGTPLDNLASFAAEVCPSLRPDQIMRLKMILGRARELRPADKAAFVDLVNDILKRTGCLIRTREDRPAKLCIRSSATCADYIQFRASGKGSFGGFYDNDWTIEPSEM